MAQFDVYKNTNLKTKKLYPFIVDIQNPLIDEIATRIVIPLGESNYFRRLAMSTLTPEISFNGEKYFLLTPQIASVPTNILKKFVGSISHLRQEIIASVDFSITGT